MIADHAKQLTSGLMGDLRQGPQTYKYHILSQAEGYHWVLDHEVPLRTSFGSGGLRFGAAASATTEGAP